MAGYGERDRPADDSAPTTSGGGYGARDLAADDVSTPGFTTTVKRTAGQMLTTAATTAEDVVGPNAVTRGARNLGQGIIDRNPAGITSLGDIPESPGLTVREAVGQFVPQIGAAGLASGVGSMIGQRIAGPAGARALGQAASNIPIYIQEYGGIRQDQQESGQESIPRALAAAAGATALERIGMGKVLAGVRGLRPAVTTIPREVAKGAAREGATEAAQTSIEQVGAFKDPTTPESLAETGLSGAMGGIGGGVVGGAQAVVERAVGPYGAKDTPADVVDNVPQRSEGVTDGQVQQVRGGTQPDAAGRQEPAVVLPNVPLEGAAQVPQAADAVPALPSAIGAGAGLQRPGDPLRATKVPVVGPLSAGANLLVEQEAAAADAGEPVQAPVSGALAGVPGGERIPVGDATESVAAVPGQPEPAGTAGTGGLATQTGAEEAPAAPVFDPKTGQIAQIERATFGSEAEVNEYLSQQRRSGGARQGRALPTQTQDGRWTFARQGEPGYGQAEQAQQQRQADEQMRADAAFEKAKGSMPQHLAELAPGNRKLYKLADAIEAVKQPPDPVSDPEGAAAALARAVDTVKELDGKLRSGNRTGATTGELVAAWTTRERARAAIENSRKANPDLWKAYDERQKALQALKLGSEVVTPDGATAVLERKFGKNWRVRTAAGDALLVPPTALRPVDKAAETPVDRPAETPRTAQEAAEAAPTSEPTSTAAIAQPAAGQAPAAGVSDGEYKSFGPETGTLGIPRAEMPQIKAGDRSSLVQFLRARGVDYAEDTVDPASLKPTQAEYSPAKVEQARGFTDTDRAILVSSDGYVVDGHHQALARVGQPARIIRLNAPIAELLPLVREFPSATTAQGGKDGTPASRREQDTAVQAVAERQRPLSESEQPVLPQLRRTGDQGAPAPRGFPDVQVGGGAAAEPTAYPGAQGQQPGVRAGQSDLGDQTRAGQQPAQERAPDGERPVEDPGRVGKADRVGAEHAAPPQGAGLDRRADRPDAESARSAAAPLDEAPGAFWTRATQADRLGLLAKAGWSVNPPSLSTKRMLAVAWDKMTDGQRERIAAATSAESVQDRSMREWAENYDRVVNAPNLADVSTKDLERADAYLSQRAAREKRKGWNGGEVNNALVEAMDRELAIFKQELTKRYAARSAEPAAAAPADARLTTAGEGVVGRRADGVLIRRDDRGVRFYVEDGVRIFETVTMRPTRAGVQVKRGELKPDFMTAAELQVASKAIEKPEVQAPAEPPAAKPPTKLQERRAAAQAERDAAAEAARAAYFTPGNVVKGYGGFDEVLAYRAPDKPGSTWAVHVHHVTKGQASGQWVRIGKPQDARWHSTQPEAREMAAGPAAGPLLYQPGELVSYTEGRADGQPFKNAPDRGTPPAPAAAAVHKDPGEPAEVATKPVVAEALATGAKRVDRPLAEMRDDLLKQIDQAIARAPTTEDADKDIGVGEPKRRNGKREFAGSRRFGDSRVDIEVREGSGDNWHIALDHGYDGATGKRRKSEVLEVFVGSAAAARGRVQNYLRSASIDEDGKPVMGKPVTFVTFDVPGDGVFKVVNTRERLEEFKRKVEMAPGFKKTRRETAPTLPGSQRGSANPTDAIADMIDSGDAQAAVDYAAQKGLVIADVLAGQKARLAKIAGLKPTQALDFSQPETAPFKRWFGDSKVVDADGKPLVVYHGTNQSFDAFSKARLGMMTRAQSATAFYFTNDPQEASLYADAAARKTVTDIDAYERKIAKLKVDIARAERARDWDRYEKLTEQWEDLEIGATRDESGGNVVPAYLSIKNPLVVQVGGAIASGKVQEHIDQARANGHDGVILRDIDDSPQFMAGRHADHFIAFEPQQVKSAIGNKGTFDPANPDIRFAGAAKVAHPSSKASARAEIASLFGRDADNVVTVVSIVDDLPANLVEPMRRAGAGGVTFDKRHVYLVADRIERGTVRGLVMHELGVHYGMAKADIARLTEQVQRWANGTGTLAEQAQWAIKAASGSKSTNKDEETLAYMVQVLVDSGVSPDAGPVGVRRFLHGVLNVLRRLARALGIRVEMTPQDMVNFAYGAAKLALRQGSPQAATPGIEFAQPQPPFVAGALNSARDLKLWSGYRLGDMLDTDGKLGWWHKTVGTPHNLAQRQPAFRRVYDATRQYIDDISYYATEAADRAPTIMPKLETARDILPVWLGGTKEPVNATDGAAISAPIFEGTLTWARDDSGKPARMADLEERAERMSTEQKARDMLKRGVLSPEVLRMWQGMPQEQYDAAVNTRYENEVLKPGIVFSRAELKSLFGLTEHQADLYEEFRDATDRSITNLVVSDMVRFGGADVQAVRERALEAKTIDEARQVLVDHIDTVLAEQPDRADVLNDTAARIIAKAKIGSDLIARGYAPLMRFGQYTLDVVDENGERVYFGLFEAPMERAKVAREMRANYPGATVRTGTTSEQEYRMFAGVSPETVELFGELLGLEAQGTGAANEAFQTYLKKAKATRSALKRLIQRKGIAGFSEDVGRVLAGFVMSNARQTSGNLHTGEIENAVDAIPQGQGQLKDAAVELTQYVRNPTEEAQRVKGLLFAQYLGGSIASAMVNALQPVQVTFPYLSQHTSIGRAAAQMGRAMKDALKPKTGDAALDQAMHLAAEKGIVSPQEVHQLIGQAAGKATLRAGDGTAAGNAAAALSNGMARLQLGWGKVFGVAEQWNRRTTFIAAYRIAKENGHADPAAFAEQAVNDTQVVFSKANRPRWARSTIGAVAFTFKTFSINYVELLYRMARSGREGRKAALLALGVLALMSGVSGLPGSDDLDDLIDGLLQRLGYNFQSKAARQRFFAETLGAGEVGARLLEHGVSALPGMPIDVSGRLGLGNLIPGTRLFTKKQDYGRDVAEIAGPIADLGQRAFQAAGKLIAGEPIAAAERILPLAGQNLVKGMQMAMTGQYKDQAGKKVLDVDAADAAVKAIGFQPADVARVQRAARTAQGMVELNKIREAEIADAWAKGIADKDPDAIAAAQADLAEWNRDNPSSPINITRQQVRRRVQTLTMDRAQRLERTAPREIRAEVRRQLQEARE